MNERFVKNDKSVVINTNKDGLLEYQSKKRQVLKEKQTEMVITSIQSQIKDIMDELNQLKQCIEDINKKI